MSSSENTEDYVIPYFFNVPGNAVYAAVWGILAILHFWRYYQVKPKQGTRWSLTLPIAECFSSAGFVLRIINRDHPNSIGLYAICNLFVVLSPVGFIAFAYMMYARLVDAHEEPTGEDEGNAGQILRKSPLAPLPPRLTGRLFIISDVTTFLIQAAGGSMQASGGQNAITGTTIFLVGVTAQGICYLLFTCLLIVTQLTILKKGRSHGKRTTFFFVLSYLVSICILIRSGFRIVEFAGGYDGYLYTTEIYLLLLDSLPLAIGNAIWVLWWPPVLFRAMKEQNAPLSKE